MDPAINSILSADNTLINYYTLGSGPGLIIVHGTYRAASDYISVAHLLAEHFTVYVPDRRGRGLSGGQGNSYDLQKETADIKALIDHTGAEYLFGHSYGGAVALEAALVLPYVQRIVVYEPALAIRTRLPADSLPAIRLAMGGHRYEQAFVDIMSILTSGTIPQINLTEMAATLAQSPMWRQVCQLLETVPGEIEAIDALSGTYDRYKRLKQPVLLLYGAKSPAETIGEMFLLADLLPDCKTIAISNAQHNGPDIENADEVAQVLTEWITEL